MPPMPPPWIGPGRHASYASSTAAGAAYHASYAAALSADAAANAANKAAAAFQLHRSTSTTEVEEKWNQYIGWLIEELCEYENKQGELT